MPDKTAVPDPSQATKTCQKQGQKGPHSMHEGVPYWHDVCCCEAEPRWVEVAEELGIDLDAGWERERP